tara:strand:- start:696 stop:1688 length:993 start_codon:yes stop_codon:yes gene_type:complete
MILKNYQLNQINLDNNKLILLYGKNEGLKKQAIIDIIKEQKNIQVYEEKEILDNSKLFIEGLSSKSLFENEKIIIVKRTTDKILKIVNDINEKILDNTTIIFNAEILEKKSKLRTLFEKDKKNICIAFYPDNEQTLSKLTFNFLKGKNILISRENINLIVNKCNGNREALLNELFKIEHFCRDGKTLTNDILTKLVNLTEDYSISELIDSCLAKNEKKTINILNENNFSSEDCILIIRIFLNKSKNILKLSSEFEKNKNIDLTISNAKPPIFWKDKEITKQQICKWKPESIRKLIYKINDLELLVKKNLNNSVNLITDFLLEQSSTKASN